MPASWLPAGDRPTRCPVIVFCGKGGVGKTTLSLSLGLEHARRGKRVIVVSSQPLTDVAMTVSLESLWRADAAAAANLQVMYIDTREILATMFERQFQTPFLTQRVLESRMYKNLVEIAPGLKELAFLSRIRDMAETPSHIGGSIDALVWDAPATGHFLEMLNAPRKFETFLSGPFAATARDLQAFFTERANLLVVPVTTLEDMSVEETIELSQALTNELRYTPAAVVCNMVSPMLQASGPSDQQPDAPMIAAAREATDLAFVMDRHRIERHEFGQLRSALPGPFLLIRRAAEWHSDVELLSAVAAQMTVAPAASE